MAVTLLISTSDRHAVEEIWREFGQTGNEHLRDLLTMHYLPRVRAIAERFAARVPRTVDMDDLLQEGALGLRRAIRLFDPKRKVLFTTFMVFHVRGAMLDKLRAEDWTSRGAQARIRAVEEARNRFALTMGRNPSEEELSAALRNDGHDPRLVLKDGRRIVQHSLSFTGRWSDSESGATWEETLASEDAPDPVDDAQKRELKELITRGLTRGERLILMLYYYENMTMKEIGETLDLSESRVSQVHTLLVRRLKAKMRGKEQLFLAAG